MNQPAETWSFDVAVEHGPHRTRAQIVLHTPDRHEFSGVGLAHRAGPARIAGYLALGRAMSDLTEELVEAATAELEAEAGRTWALESRDAGRRAEGEGARRPAGQTLPT